jgi:hypothetical protein
MDCRHSSCLVGDVNFRESQVKSSEADGLQFVPAVVDVTSSAFTARRQRKAPPCKAEPGAGKIEVEIDGIRIHVGRGADIEIVRAVRLSQNTSPPLSQPFRIARHLDLALPAKSTHSRCNSRIRQGPAQPVGISSFASGLFGIPNA